MLRNLTTQHSMHTTDGWIAMIKVLVIDIAVVMTTFWSIATDENWTKALGFLTGIAGLIYMILKVANEGKSFFTKKRRFKRRTNGRTKKIL